MGKLLLDATIVPRKFAAAAPGAGEVAIRMSVTDADGVPRTGLRFDALTNYGVTAITESQEPDGLPGPGALELAYEGEFPQLRGVVAPGIYQMRLIQPPAGIWSSERYTVVIDFGTAADRGRVAFLLDLRDMNSPVVIR